MRVHKLQTRAAREADEDPYGGEDDQNKDDEEKPAEENPSTSSSSLFQGTTTTKRPADDKSSASTTTSPTTSESTTTSSTSTTTSTTPKHCEDKLNPKTQVSDCPRVQYLCYNPIYSELMTEQCPKTCRKCKDSASDDSPSSNKKCVDKTNPRTQTSDCSRLTYLCENPIYYNLMTDQCPYTCKRCT
ncbi:shTK domain protein [Necator americanus]|uniref:ShTK domain protein n=1 Tax=Necator americanus TaxID=51031 RepID=W2T7N9_NECAM|nr:shTK domain protein [Necator americanus]ETN77181.1 shTK domain protein [Necator americanus]